MCGQPIVRDIARDNTVENIDKGHTFSTRIEFKIYHSVRNRTRAAKLEDSDGPLLIYHFITNISVIFTLYFFVYVMVYYPLVCFVMLD